MSDIKIIYWILHIDHKYWWGGWGEIESIILDNRSESKCICFSRVWLRASIDENDLDIVWEAGAADVTNNDADLRH